MDLGAVTTLTRSASSIASSAGVSASVSQVPPQDTEGQDWLLQAVFGKGFAKGRSKGKGKGKTKFKDRAKAWRRELRYRLLDCRQSRRRECSDGDPGEQRHVGSVVALAILPKSAPRLTRPEEEQDNQAEQCADLLMRS